MRGMNVSLLCACRLPRSGFARAPTYLRPIFAAREVATDPGQAVLFRSRLEIELVEDRPWRHRGANVGQQDAGRVSGAADDLQRARLLRKRDDCIADQFSV